ncbi:MAG: hypothetical protein K6B40_09085 [Firmicutes bacterium]|nr:hypothetical protein [Bacillota bacterium]
MKRSFLAILVLCAALLLCACNGGQGNKTDTASDSDIDVLIPASTSDITINGGEQPWPIDTFFIHLPNAAETVDSVAANEDKTAYSLMKKEMRYEDFARYIAALEDEGFVCANPIGLDGSEPADGFAAWQASKDGIAIDTVWTNDKSAKRSGEYDFVISFTQE